MTERHPAPRLRDQIPAGEYARRALIDAPELEALERLVDGSLSSADELERCEDALRGLLLHERCSAIDPSRALAPWLTAAPALVTEMVVPPLRHHGDDPSVPAELLADLTATDAIFSRYQNAPTERFTAGADGMIELIDPGSGPVAGNEPTRERGLAPSGMRAVLADAEQVEKRAERLLAGYFGAGAIIAGAHDPEELPATGHSIPLLLQKLDEWFDPVSRTPDVAMPYLSLRPLLGAVLSRASRNRIPETIRELHHKLTRAVRELHAALGAFEEAAVTQQTSAQRIDRLEVLLGAARRIDILTGSDEAPRRVRVRGLSPPAAGWLAKAARAGGITAELSSDVSRMIADASTDSWRRLAPTLANLITAGEKPAARIPSMTLLKRHLMPAQLESVHASQRR